MHGFQARLTYFMPASASCPPFIQCRHLRPWFQATDLIQRQVDRVHVPALYPRQGSRQLPGSNPVWEGARGKIAI